MFITIHHNGLTMLVEMVPDLRRKLEHIGYSVTDDQWTEHMKSWTVR